MANPWPFVENRMSAAITLLRIVRGDAPVLAAWHSAPVDEADSGWMFLDGEHVEESDSAVATLEEMIGLDPTLREIADLPVGWVAWRAGKGKEWHRNQQ